MGPYNLDPGNTRALILYYLPFGLVNVTFFFYHYKCKTVLHSCIVCSLMCCQLWWFKSLELFKRKCLWQDIQQTDTPVVWSVSCSITLIGFCLLSSTSPCYNVKSLSRSFSMNTFHVFFCLVCIKKNTTTNLHFCLLFYTEYLSKGY